MQPGTGKGLRNDAGRDARMGVLAWIERHLGLTPAGVGVIVVVILGFVAGRLLQSRGLFLAVYGMLFAVGLSWVLGRRKLKVEAVRSDLPGRVRPGQVLQAELELTAGQRLTTLVIEEQLPGEVGLPVRIPVPLLPRGKTVSHAYELSPKTRGVYDIGPLVAEWSDPFGLTRRRQPIAKAQRIIVHPRVEPALDRIVTRAWEDPPVRPPISKPWPTGFEFYGMREYSYGDDPRRIVWRAVAQYGTYLVRESEQGITDRINIVLDTDRRYHSPGQVSETFETAVSAVASLARKHLSDGLSVTIDTNGGQLVGDLRGRGKIVPLFDKLAGVKPEPESLTAALDRCLSRMTSHTHNIVVTPHLTADVARRLRIILDKGAHLLLALVLWDDTDPATVHRAGLLHCHVVELQPRVALGRAFGNVVDGAMRR